jgi:hypothetical protein
MGGAVREKSEESAAWRWGSVFIASPLYDTVFFIFSPLIALGLVLFLDGWSAAHSRYAILGAEQYPVPVFITIWTHAHLVAVFFRSHGDRQIFARHRAAFTVVPLGLFGLFLLSDHAIIAGLVVSVFWATYHIGMQNFGLSRIYDVRCGNDPQAGRQLDWGLHQLLNLGPFLVGASLMPSLESFRRFDAVGWVAPGEWVSAYRGLHGVLTPTILIAGGFYLVYYLYSYRELVRSGHVICPQKVTQIVVTGAVSIGAWGLMEPWMAVLRARVVDGAREPSARATAARRWRRRGPGAARLRAADRDLRSALAEIRGRLRGPALDRGLGRGRGPDALLVRRLRLVGAAARGLRSRVRPNHETRRRPPRRAARHLRHRAAGGRTPPARAGAGPGGRAPSGR